MASHFYSIAAFPAVSVDPNSVTKATSTQAGNHIELRVDDGVTGDSRLSIVFALEAIRNFLLRDIAPA